MDILSETIKYCGKYLTLTSVSYRDKHDKDKEWEMVSRVNDTKAVMIVGFKESTLYEGRKLLLIKEFRIPINDYEWGFPAGLIDGNESIEETVKRELHEETGMYVKNILEISPFVYNSAGMTNESIAMAFVEVEGDISDKNQESSEDIQVFLKNQGQVYDLIYNGIDNKFGAKAWLIMKLFAREGRII